MFVVSRGDVSASAEDGDSAPLSALVPLRCLSRVVTIGADTPAPALFKALGQARVTALFDIRVHPDGKDARIPQADFSYLCWLHGILYIPAPELMPSAVSWKRYSAGSRKFRMVGDPGSYAWTRFLKDYARSLRAREPFDAGTFYQEGICGQHSIVALLGKSERPQDCHRVYALGLLLRKLRSLNGEHLVGSGASPRKRKEPFKPLFEDFPDAGLRANAYLCR